MGEGVTLIRWNEATELLRQVKDDLVMDQLLNYANYVVLKRFQSQGVDELPKADFDLYFYLETVKQICEKRDPLRGVLAKEDSWDFIKYIEQRDELHKSMRLVYYCMTERPDDSSFYKMLDALLETSQSPHLDSPFQPYRNSKSNKEMARLLRWRESMLALSNQIELSHRGYSLSADNIPLLYSVYVVLRRLREGDEPPAADFDLYFFVRAMQEFFSDHSFLSKILAGEDLRWFSDMDAPTEIHR